MFHNSCMVQSHGVGRQNSSFETAIYSLGIKPQWKMISTEDIIRGAVEVERDFICGALPCDLIGMNKDDLDHEWPRLRAFTEPTWQWNVFAKEGKDAGRWEMGV